MLDSCPGRKTDFKRERASRSRIEDVNPSASSRRNMTPQGGAGGPPRVRGDTTPEAAQVATRNAVIKRTWCGASDPGGGKRISNASEEVALESKTSTPAHRVEEIRVVLGLLDLVQQEFHRLELVHRIEELAQHPHLLQDLRLQQQFFL